MSGLTKCPTIKKVSMNGIKKYAITCLAVLIGISCYAQSRTFEEISKLRVQNTGVIMDGKSVKGYFFFYSLGKAKKGKRTFILNILDENLNDVKATTLIEDKRTVLISGLYNGDFICLKFYNSYQSQNSYLFFDKKGNQVHRQDRSTNIRNRTRLYSVPGKGFVEYTAITDNGSFNMQFLPNPPYESNESQEPWVYTHENDFRANTNVSMLCLTDNIVVNLLANSRSSNGKKMNFSIQGISIETGTVVFKSALTETYNMQPVNAYVDDNNIINVLGMYYPPDVNIIKENATGLFNHQIDESGEIVDEKYLSWTYEMRDFITIDNNGKVSNENQSGFLYFHDIVKHTDGTILAIAEQYRKTVDAAGIATNILTIAAAAAVGGYVGGSAGMTKLVIGDLVLFRFNPDFSIQSVDFMNKTTTDFNLPSGYGFSNVHLLSEIISNSGGFDFRYATQDEDEAVTTVGYVDYEKEKGQTREWVFNAVSLYEGALVKDRLPLGTPRDLWSRSILPAKVGNILVIDYSKSEKKLEMHLERINY